VFFHLITFLTADENEKQRSSYKLKGDGHNELHTTISWHSPLLTHTVKSPVLSRKSRGLRKKAGTDDQVPTLIESEISYKEFRKNWARLIQEIYNVNHKNSSQICCGVKNEEGG